MGYVYTPQEYEEGKVATERDFKFAMGMLAGELGSLSEEGVIFGANIHGSNTNCDGGPGSDIDTLVITKSPDAEERLRLARLKVWENFNVPVEFVPVPVEMAKAGHHTIDRLYALYMQTFCKDGIVGGDPFTVLAPTETWDNPLHVVIERFQTQLTKLAKQRSMLSQEYSEWHCMHLENMMRWPIYSAIDLLKLRFGNYPSKKGKPLSKAGCCRMFFDEFSDLANIEPDLQAVLDTRTEYRQFLQRNGTSVSAYKDLLGSTDCIYPSARRVIQANFDYLSGGGLTTVCGLS